MGGVESGKFINKPGFEQRILSSPWRQTQRVDMLMTRREQQGHDWLIHQNSHACVLGGSHMRNSRMLELP